MVQFFLKRKTLRRIGPCFSVALGAFEIFFRDMVNKGVCGLDLSADNRLI